MKSFRIAFAAALLAAPLVAQTATLPYCTDESQLFAPDTGIRDHFGSSLAAQGSWLVVGADNADTSPGVGPGIAYVFQRTGGGWGLHTTLVGLGSDDNDQFGAACAIDGDTIVVGAPFGLPSFEGLAFVFRLVGGVWSQEAVLQASDPMPSDNFGWSVAVRGDRILVGAPHKDFNEGLVYEFARSGTSWSEVDRIPAPSPGLELGRFGSTLLLDADRAYVGAPAGFDPPACVSDTGAVFVYRHEVGAWVGEASLYPSICAGESFGAAMDVDATTLVVGRPEDEEHGSQTGAAYVFERIGTTWTETGRLLASDGEAQDELGRSVAIEGDRIAAGAPTRFGLGGPGSVYLFGRHSGTWREQGVLRSSDAPQSWYWYGQALAIEDGELFVGDPRNDVLGWEAGKAYVHTWIDAVTYCTAKVNSQGCSPRMGYCGVPSATDPSPFDLTAVLVLNNKHGLLFYGTNGPQATPFQGGTMCVAGSPRRTPIQSSGGNPPPNDCSGTFAFDFNARIQSGQDPSLVSGVVVNAQYWSRDGQSTFGVNLTDAVEFTIQP